MKTIENIEFGQLAAQFGTPLYVYSENELTQAYARYQAAFAALNPLICYAVKANSNLSIIQHFAQLGSGFDTVSGGEIARVLAAGGSADKIIFSGVGKTEAEMAFALNAGIKCFNVESLPELDRLNAVAAKLGKTAPVSLRINPDVDAKTHPYISTGLKSNKFGIAMQDAERAYRHAASLPKLKIIGIDCHIGSQLTDLSPLVEACGRILDLTEKLHSLLRKHRDVKNGLINERKWKNAIQKHIEILTQSDIIREKKLKVANEITNVLEYYNLSFIKAIAKLMTEYKLLLEENNIELKNETPITKGMWIGGDRDGNPFVTAETLNLSAMKQCELITTYYIEKLNSLYRTFSMSSHVTKGSKKLEELANRSSDTSEYREKELYRRALSYIKEKLENTLLKRHSLSRILNLNLILSSCISSDYHCELSNDC